MSYAYGERNLQKRKPNFSILFFMSRITFGNLYADIVLILWSGVPRTKISVNWLQISILKYFIDMIFDNDPLISKFISAPKDLQSLNCAIFYGGMIESILNSSGYVYSKELLIYLCFLEI